MICLSFEMEQRGGWVLLNLSQVAESLNLNAAHLILLPEYTWKLLDLSLFFPHACCPLFGH